MKKYTVVIMETLRKEISGVQADSEQEAMGKVEEKFINGNITLDVDADDFDTRYFATEEQEENYGTENQRRG